MVKHLSILAGLLLSILILSSFSVYDPTCENESLPLGIDTPHPTFSWKIHSESRSFQQYAYQIVVGTESDFSESHCLWNSGKILSDESILRPYSGPALKSFSIYYWRVRVWDTHGNASPWSCTRKFVMGVLTPADWVKALWIGLEKDDPQSYLVPGLHGLDEVKKKLGSRKTETYKLPYLRRDIAITKRIKSAYAYVSGLGQFDFFINGEKVGDHFLDPGWTKYDKEMLYVTFDVSQQLRKGGNALGIMLGNGFYNIPGQRYFKLLTSYGAPKMKMLLHIEYEDGTTDNIVSDKSWRATEGPLTYSSIYGGEDFDATKAIPGWNLPGFNDSQWSKPVSYKLQVPMLSQRNHPVTIRQEVPTVKITRNPKGWLYDLGQNCSGIVRVTLKAPKGGTVILRPGELLNTDSTVNQSASGQPYYFAYTAQPSDSTVTWQPQFTYYGFRYVQVEDAAPESHSKDSDIPKILSINGLHTCNSAPETGRFWCSNPLFNRIYTLIDWAIRSNMSSILTDCPHREKLGWIEQDYLMQYSMQYRYDLRSMYNQMMRNMSTSQREDGCIPSICPEYVRFASGFEDSPEWGSAFILCPWYYYLTYGDSRLLSTYYKAMQRYVDYLGKRSDRGIVSYGLGDWCDIGPSAPGYSQLTSYGVTATAIYYSDIQVMKQTAALLGKTADKIRYDSLGREVKRAFQTKYFHRDKGIIDRNSQTANAMPLYVGLVDSTDAETVLQHLVDDIRQRGNALTAGDIGYRYVLQTLARYGRSDVVFDMNSRYDVPGYGWQLAHGATALTESWQAYGFCSNNHLMLGHLMEWLFGSLGGIRQAPQSTGYRHLIFDPQAVGDISEARTTYTTPYGTAECNWKKTADSYSMEVLVPANSKADVVLPTTTADSITDYGVSIKQAKGVISISHHGDETLLTLGSGAYNFKIDKH